MTSTEPRRLHPPEAFLPDEDLRRLATDPARRRFAAGSVILNEGEPGTEMFVILEGDVEITLKGAVIDRLTPGTIVGEMALVDDRPRSATATAASDTVLVPIDRAHFLELVQEHPDFATRVMTIMSIRLRRLIEEEVKRQRMEQELVIGQRIQLSLLPRGCPQVPGWEFAAGYRAAREVGGDLYDFIASPLNPAEVHVVVADVTGKGVPAALYMAVSRTVLHTQALEGRSPSEALQRTNDFIRQDAQSPLFLSAFYLALETDTACARYANAGHNPPFWLHNATGEIELLHARGLLLGAFDGFLNEERTCTLEPGDFLVLYTDGITEARNTQGKFFEDEGLHAVVASRPWGSADELMQAIVSAVDGFTGDAPQSDDFTVIVIRRQPESNPR